MQPGPGSSRTQERIQDRGRPPVRLLCFHHAGGSPVSFLGWQRALGEAVDVVPVSLPGREVDGASRRYDDMDSLARALEDELGPVLETPYLVYGHSMGALVAYRLALRRARLARRTPERLLVGAYPAPHLPHPLAHGAHLSDEDLSALLLDLSQLPERLTADRQWLNERVRLIRADLRLCGTHRGQRPPDALPCPIDVFTGAADPLVNTEAAHAWAFHSRKECTVHVLPGGHFFPRESKFSFFERLRPIISRVAEVT
ncbi:thioesterase II family protein [Streptomyces sp. NBC_00147]|uniref:thioesterase II family protein n=1 Tax=Streptomyces sp. NBC_00147 TaxID=2975667 RepID=UPI003255971E